MSQTQEPQAVDRSEESLQARPWPWLSEPESITYVGNPAKPQALAQ